MEELSIKLENGIWTVNGRTFQDMTLSDRFLLSAFIKSYSNEMEVVDE